jgi:TPR repeat protein
MSGRAIGGAVKRQREQKVEKEDASASTQVTVHAKPLTLLAVVKLFYDTLVWLQLCNVQGAALFSFVQTPLPLPRPFAGAPVYGSLLTHAERLRALGCGFQGKLVQLLSLGVGRHFEPQRNRRACHQMMQSNVRHIAAGLAAAAVRALRNKAAKEAEELCASGQCAAAVVALQRAIDLGDLPSRALKAWLLIGGREGVTEDQMKAFQLVEEGARLGCHHCQGVLAFCYFSGYGCRTNSARSLELARESSGRGSRYGQCALGWLFLNFCRGGPAQDYAQSLALYRLAAAQGLDEAQYSLGRLFNDCPYIVATDKAEAMRWWQLAAAQGHRDALSTIARCHEHGWVVRKNIAEAIRWYSRAAATGCIVSAYNVRRLCA